MLILFITFFVHKYSIALQISKPNLFKSMTVNLSDGTPFLEKLTYFV